MGKQQANTPATSQRRRIVAVVLAVGVALCVGVGAWALQANQGSGALATVAAEKAQESKATEKDAGSSSASTKDASSKKSEDSGKKPGAGNSSSSSAQTSAQPEAHDEPAQQEVVEVQEVPEEVEQPAEEPIENVEGTDPGGETQGSDEPVASETEEVAQEEPEPTSVTVQVVVDGSPAGGSQRDESVELAVGANAYDALVATGANVNARSTVYGTYVAAIDGLAEKEHGSMSGWVYAVNGVEPSTACSNYVLQDGDVVVWTYVNVED